MENKKTTELINLLQNLKDEDYKTGGKYEETMTELVSREPFLTILGENEDESIPALGEKVKELQSEVKKLKRHKHDEKSGDVLIRI